MKLIPIILSASALAGIASQSRAASCGQVVVVACCEQSELASPAETFAQCAARLIKGPDVDPMALNECKIKYCPEAKSVGNGQFEIPSQRADGACSDVKKYPDRTAKIVDCQK